LLRKVAAAIVLVPLAVVMIAFAVANRQDVTVSFDPFSSNEPAASLTLPLFALMVLLLIIGVLFGGMASWLRHHKWRGAARRFERELRGLRGKLAALEGAEKPPVRAGETNPPTRLRLQPPAR
jgi:uncharacterized integral membrane protein